MMNCNNCNQTFNGKHCNACGQKASVGDLNFKALLHEIWHSVTHTDNGILKLIKDLFLHPKQVYLGYFSGQRKTYFSPVTFFLISIAILLFLGIKIFDYEDYKIEMFNEFGRHIFEETKFKTFVILPIMAFLTWLISHKQLNFAKNTVFWLFLFGFIFSIKILLTPIYFIFISYKQEIDSIVYICQLFIILWHLILLFGHKKVLKIIYCLILIIILMVLDYIISIYFLFGDNFMEKTNAKNVLDLILDAYKII